MYEYDYLIVGSGLFGCVFAHEISKLNKRCLVIEKRNHLGGNIYNEKINDINVHKYGAHIFHTNDEKIWDYVNQFTKFNNYINSPIAINDHRTFNLPFNMNTFYQLWGVNKPEDAINIINKQSEKYKNVEPKNLEEQALSFVGEDIYYTLIKGYTEKQWGRSAKELPVSIIKRIPLRFIFDNNYFNDRYQGIPVDGYNPIIFKLLENIEYKLDIDYFENRQYWQKIAKKIVYTGPIDKFYDYKYGKLEYRSLRFENEFLEHIDNFQGNAVVNYTNYNIPYTRIIEHKHFEFGKQKGTIITKEYPSLLGNENEPYYPVNDTVNNKTYKQYSDLNKQNTNILFGGRLAEYKYYDMHQIIASSLTLVKKEINDLYSMSSI
jgi:UDP-galactopyranose mutase